MYDITVLPMPDDFEGQVVATLVSRRAEAGSRRAVLYLHGFTDYFFQDHLAEHYVQRGIDFYALDLRKYGRSLLPHQTRGLIRSVTRLLPRDRRGRADHPPRPRRLGDDQRPFHGRADRAAVGRPGARRGAWCRGWCSTARSSTSTCPRRCGWRPTCSGRRCRTAAGYCRWAPEHRSTGRTLHRDEQGEWNYDLELKPLGGFSVHAMWLAAIRRGAAAAAPGPVGGHVPVLVLASSTGLRVRDFVPEARSADIVLDPRHIARWSTSLGPARDVRADPGRAATTVVLSAEPARKQVLRRAGPLGWPAYLSGDTATHSGDRLHQGNENRP
ncbi:alpha/beta hydrolase [Nonomuraea rubra]|uniref:alpha/beta hydrolase n=1 Tax=Nonomuraea rubra TaxID=46180 RepID=UPI0031EF348E